jgi:hypothetical protein
MKERRPVLQRRSLGCFSVPMTVYFPCREPGYYAAETLKHPTCQSPAPRITPTVSFIILATAGK